MKFSELKIGTKFYDPRNPDDVCVKTHADGARSNYCTVHFYLSFGPDEVCEVVK